MRSRERGRAWAAVALVVTAMLFAALGAWALVARSTIPLELDGTVTAVELRHEKHPGVDDVWLVSVDGERLRHVDAEVAAFVEEGDVVQKDAWSSTLVVDGHAHVVELSADARSMLLLAPALAVVVAVLAAVTCLPPRDPRR